MMSLCFILGVLERASERVRRLASIWTGHIMNERRQFVLKMMDDNYGSDRILRWVLIERIFERVCLDFELFSFSMHVDERDVS